MIEIIPTNPESDSIEPEHSSSERRKQRLADWRAANRDHLRQYGNNWKLEHPDRVKLHRENEFIHRRKKRRRLRLRREAQRRRRALERLRFTDPIAWAKLKGRNH